MIPRRSNDGAAAVWPLVLVLVLVSVLYSKSARADFESGISNRIGVV